MGTHPVTYTAVKVYMLLLSACTTFVTVTFLNTTIGQPSVKLNHLILQHHVIYVNIGARSCLLCVVIQGFIQAPFFGGGEELSPPQTSQLPPPPRIFGQL